MLPGQRADAPDAAADDHVDAVPVHLTGVEVGLPAGFLRRHGGELGETVHPARLFAIQVVFGIEPLDLGGEPGVKRLGVKTGNVVNTRPAGGDGVPAVGYVESQRADHPQARYHHPTVSCAVAGHTSSLAWGCDAGRRNPGRRSAFR